MWNRIAIYFWLSAFCTARLQTDHRTREILPNRTSSFIGLLCIENGTVCDPITTCADCCAREWYMIDHVLQTWVCGATSCLDDGTVCAIGSRNDCNKCCNGSFEDNGTTCGGQCLPHETPCHAFGPHANCDLCCSFTGLQYREDGYAYKCGCIEDGTQCIPGDSCYKCCNDSYNNGGSACGGKCIEDGVECTIGEDCNLCCNFNTFWHKTGKHHCGTEPCYSDGVSCIPEVTCKNCCSGGAYSGDGTVCGGTCIVAGNKCSYHSTCTQCCDVGPRAYDSSNLHEGSYTVSTTPYHWDRKIGSMSCGYELCWEDGIDCIPGYDCNKCCNVTFSATIGKCGAPCRKNGVKCNHYSTCYECCETSAYDSSLGYHFCADFPEQSDYPSIVPSSLPSSNILSE
jgi:hypothetical protein